MLPVRRILVPTDFSKPALAALRWAGALAEEFGSRVHLLHVVPEPYAYPWGTEISPLPVNDLLAQSEATARQHLNKLAAQLGLPRGRTRVKAEIGTPVDRILTTIDEERIDLVVVGRHGRGIVGHLLLGSVAEKVVRQSPVPVLTVHGKDAGKRKSKVKS